MIGQVPPAAQPNRRRFMRQLALGGLGMGCVGGLSGLWLDAAMQGTLSDQASRPGFTLIRHQLGWAKGVQFGGEYVAQAQGWFERERLDVRLAAGGPNTSFRTLVASGRALVSESTVPGMIEGYAQGQPLVAFGAVMQNDPACLISSAGRPIRSLRDMVGRTIGAPNNISGQITVLLRRAGLDPTQVRFVPVGSDASMLVAGQVDAIYAWATTALPTLQLAGFAAHATHMSDLGAPGYGGVLIARRDRLERDFDHFVGYMRALIKGWQYMVAHPRNTAEMVVRDWAPPGTSLAEQTLQAEMMVTYINAGDALTHGLLWIDPEVFEANVLLMRDAGAIPGGLQVDLRKLVNREVVRAAHASL